MDQRSKSAIVVGTLLILLGVFFLVTRLVPGLFDTISWPFLVIGVGAIFMIIAVVTWTPGLAVAVPSVVLFNYFSRRIERFVSDMELAASETADLIGR